MIVRSAMIALLAMLLVSCEEETNDMDESYDASDVMELRSEKDDAFRGSDSPIPQANRASFTGLKYYDVDERYAVEAQVEYFETGDTVTIGTSTSEVRKAIKRAAFHMDIVAKGTTTLYGYEFVGGLATELFVPFSDATNGKTTYEAGRYLDVDVDGKPDHVMVDFNRAYNPYCAYNHDFSCPLVPASNRLRFAIEAGERM